MSLSDAADGKLTPRRRRRVLVVDDEELVRSLLVEMFASMGIEADAASSGFDALGILTKNSYDLVLTDHVMPEMSGLQFIDVARRLTPETPFAVLSGSLLPEEVDGWRAIGLTVLTKPIALRDFRAAMERLLGL